MREREQIRRASLASRIFQRHDSGLRPEPPSTASESRRKTDVFCFQISGMKSGSFWASFCARLCRDTREVSVSKGTEAELLLGNSMGWGGGGVEALLKVIGFHCFYLGRQDFRGA